MRFAARMTGIAACSLACVLALACHPKPPKPIPMFAPVTRLSLAVSADVNPDSQGRPSPIVVRIYQLKDDAAFQGADYFALFDKEQATLAGALVSRQEYELRPGEQRMLDYAVAPETLFLGVAAAYRDIRNAQWHALTSAPDTKPNKVARVNKVVVSVERARLSLSSN